MNEEIDKLKQKIRAIDEKINKTEEENVKVTEVKHETISVTIPEEPREGIRLGIEAEEKEMDEIGETFELDFSGIELSDTEIENIIKNAADKSTDEKSVDKPNEEVFHEPLPVNPLGLDRSPAPKIVLTQTNDGKMWKLDRECVYTTDNGVTIIVPRGFITDLASVPRVFWVIVASFELSLPGPIFHDLIYRCAGEVPNDLVDPDHVFARDETDGIFLELMEKSGVAYWKRRVAYRAVRTFAQFAWNKIGVITEED